MTVVFEEEKLHEFVKENKIQSFREKQILHELYKNQNISREEMTTLPKDLRETLSTHFQIINLSNEQIVETEDTTKFGFKTAD